MIEKKDSAAVAALCGTCLGHETDAAHIARRIEDFAGNGQYYLAVYEEDGTGRIAGFMQAERYDLLYAENGWNVIALAVDPQCRRRGIGKALLAALEEKVFRENSALKKDTFIRLNCNIKRSEAHAFYRDAGYLCDKTQKRFIRHIS